MLENTIKNKVGDLINQVKSNCFMPNANPTARQAFGLMMSKFFKWSGICIAEAAVYALRDSNFRMLAENIETLIEYELMDSGQHGCVIVSKRRFDHLVRVAEENG